MKWLQCFRKRLAVRKSVYLRFTAQAFSDKTPRAKEKSYVRHWEIYCSPNCDTEQKHLNLDETDGSFVCSKCGAQTKINMEKLKKVTLKKETAN